MNIAVVWFRRDLRLADNPALAAAAARGSVVAVFLPDEEERGDWASGTASRLWLHESLRHLNHSLNNKLLLLRGNAEQVLPQLMRQIGANALYYNCRYEPEQRQREQQIACAMPPSSTLHSFHGSVLIPPECIKNKSGGLYQIFTPFYRHGYLASFTAAPPPPLSAPHPLQLAAIDVPRALPRLAADELPAASARRRAILTHWQPGEAAALKAMKTFTAVQANYAAQRDFPAVKGVSRLSPHLHFGEISPRQVQAAVNNNDSPFLRQLIWREFSTYLLYHFPDLPTHNWRREFDAFPWRADEKMLRCWQQGRTGIPIVDAGMRELQESGYMHNRVRMVTASFLTKNLLLPWQDGARWFWDCLVDADLGNNSAGWQWVAGSGSDAAPYFRIFNPLLQSKKFDPAGEYIARYLPELRHLPPAQRHQPWCCADAPRSYPPPIVDLNHSRQRALAAYSDMKTAVKNSRDDHR